MVVNISMNFYIVPSGLYQTQQKMKSKSKTTKKRRSSRGLQASRKSSDTKSYISESINLRSLLEISKTLSLTNVSETFEDTALRIEKDEGREEIVSRDFEGCMRPTQDQISNIESQLLGHLKSDLAHRDQRSSRSQRFSQVPSASLILSPTCGGIEIKPNCSGSKDNKMADLQPKAHPEIPKFDLIMSVSRLNSETFIKRSFLTPTFQVLRYKNYLEMLESQHEADAVSYADVRIQSFGKFVKKLLSDRTGVTGFQGNDADLYRHEGILACELFKCRQFLRKLIASKLNMQKPNPAFYIPEELVQANFTNYVRFLLSLPLTLPDFFDHLDPVTASHYRFKSSIQELKDKLNSIAQDGLGNETLVLPGADVIVQAITKVSYEYILLEQYHIDVLAKMGSNSLLDRRIVRLLFNLFNLNMKLDNTESLKILNFNIFFSAQYSWNLALTIPFVRVFESNIFVEDDLMVSSEMSVSESPFKKLDEELYKSYFKELKFDTFDSFSALTKADLVKMRKRLEDLNTSGGQLGVKSRHKPENFEYLRQSIFQIKSETFHVIQSRDLYLQLDHTNYQTVLRQFHRILKNGGILELPIHIPKLSPRSATMVSRFPTTSSDEIYLRDQELLKDFVNTIVGELNGIFGTKNVMLGTVLISADSKMSSFVSNHISLRLHDMYEDIESFLSSFDNQHSAHNHLGNYYFYIRAEKI